MTDREKAIVMAYTGISMLEGDKLNVFYRYLAELYGRPVYTHELIALDIEHKSKPDFLKLCDEEEPERKTGKWIPAFDGKFRGGAYWFNCSKCGHMVVGVMSIKRFNYCPSCGLKMEGVEQE